MITKAELLDRLSAVSNSVFNFEFSDEQYKDIQSLIAKLEAIVNE